MKNNIKYIGQFILFFIWPAGALLVASQNFQKKESQKTVYLFVILFGLTFILGNKDLDSFVYAQQFSEMANISFKDFSVVFSNFLLSEKTLDLAKPVISFIVSRFTSDYHWYFGVIAAIFGHFYVKSISLVYHEYSKNKTQISLLLILFFVFIINPVFNINGFRFWTATWIFFLGSYKLIFSGEKKHIFTCLLAMLFHFSFLIPNIVLLLYFILGNRNKFYFILLISSFIVSDFVFQIFPQIMEYLPDGIVAKSGRYASTERMEEISEHAEWAKNQGKWYLYLPGKLTFYYITIVFLFLHSKYKKFRLLPAQQKLFSFSLLFLAFSNTVSFIPSMVRFRTLFLLFGIASIMSLLSSVKIKKTRLLLYIGLLPFILNLIVVLRLGFDVLNPWLFTLLPLPFVFDDISIYQWLFK